MIRSFNGRLKAFAPIVPLPQIKPSSHVFAGWELTNPRSGTGNDSEAVAKVAIRGRNVARMICFMTGVLHWGLCPSSEFYTRQHCPPQPSPLVISVRTLSIRLHAIHPLQRGQVPLASRQCRPSKRLSSYPTVSGQTGQQAPPESSEPTVHTSAGKIRTGTGPLAVGGGPYMTARR